jgi:hypothetical protein
VLVSLDKLITSEVQKGKVKGEEKKKKKKKQTKLKWAPIV